MLYIYINRMSQQIKNNKPLKTINKCDCCCKSWQNNKAGVDTCSCSCSNCYELLRDCKYSCYVLKINKIELQKEQLTERKKQYYQDNKEQAKQYRDNHKEQIK